MGMDYYIIPNQETECENDFPEGLSNFFEQVGGYSQFAEVSQVSRILQIDLSIFQQLSWDEDELEEDEDGDKAEEPSTHWHELSMFSAIVDDFLTKLTNQPQYYTQVLHNPGRENDLSRLEQILTNTTDETSRIKEFEQVVQQPLYHYPPDYGYLSQGSLVEDLLALRATLQCYQSSGVTQIKLVYM